MSKTACARHTRRRITSALFHHSIFGLLLFFIAGLRIAQGLTCIPNTGTPVVVRAEGTTELTGDILITCTGGAPTTAGQPIPQFDITISLNTNITSRLLGGAGLSGRTFIDALLIVDEAAPAVQDPPSTVVSVPANPSGYPNIIQSAPCFSDASGGSSSPAACNAINGTGGLSDPYVNTNIFVAQQQSANTIAWLGVPIDAPSGNGARTLRITNIRANASQLGVSSTFVPVQIVAILGISGSQSILLNIPQVTVAVSVAGLIVTAPTSTPAPNLPQCTSPAGDFFGSSASGPSTFTVRVQEGFGAAFKRRVIQPAETFNAPTIGPGGGAPGLQNIPGYGYPTESGFVTGNQGAATAPFGLTDAGTRFLIRFSNVGAGTHLILGTIVPLTLIDNVTPSVPRPPSSVGGYHGAFMQLIAGAVDQFGDPSSSSPVFANSTMTFTDLSAPFNGGIEIPVVNGSAYALYEVMNADFAAIERGNIPVGVSYTANPNQNLPGTGAVTANVSFAPIGPISSAYGSADPALPLPRYGDTSTPQTVFSINSCNAVTASAVNPSSGSGSSQTFQFLASDSSGAADLQTIWMWFTPSFNAATANSCLLYYNRTSNQINLLADAGNTWMSTIPGTAGTLQNSQCSVDGGTAAITPSGNSLAVSIPVSFKAAYAGNQQVWMYASGAAGNSGWQQRGTWTAIAPVIPVVSAVSVTPNTGTGSIQSFQFVSSDTSGAADLQTVWVWFTPAFSGSIANSCLLYYNRAANLINLLDDAGSNWMSIAPDTFAGTLENSQCILATGQITASISGNNLILVIPVTFKARYAGAQQVWMYASGGVGNSGWQQRGTWTVAAPIISATSVTPNSGSGASQTFQFLFSDSAGFADSPQVLVWFTTAFSNSSANSCLFHYDWRTNTLYLLNDAGDGWTSATAIISGTLQNSQCSFRTGPSAITASGTDLTLSLPVSFTARYAGNQQVWMYASGGSSNSGWQQRGTWTVPVPAAPTVSAVSVTPNAGSGTTQNFGVLVSDSLGAADLQTVWMWFTPSFNSSTSNSCLVYYNQTTNQINLLNDAGNSWLSMSVGSGTLQNSQCSVDVSTAVLTPSGNNLTVSLPISFKAAYAGNQQVWMYAAAASANSGWQQRGAWTATAPAAAVSAVSVTPNSGSGSSQTFQFLASDASGATDLQTVWMWITPSFSSPTANSCLIYYNRANNMLNLLNDAGNSWMSMSVGVAGILQNNQCSVNAGTTTVTPSGNNLTLSIPVSFKAAYAGNQQVWMYAAGPAGNSGWQQRGTWTATAPSAPVSAVSVTPNSGSGPSQTFQFVASDASGLTDLQTVWMWFTPAFSSPTANSCLLYYNRATNVLNLLNDAGNSWMSASGIGQFVLQNTQCSLSVTPTGIATADGNNLTLSLQVSFKAPYAGSQQVWMYAAGNSSNSGWNQIGAWTATGPVVSAVSVTPNSGSGLSQTFQFQFSDSSSATDFQSVWMWFTPSFGSPTAGSCRLYFDQASSQINLLNDAGTAWLSARPVAQVTLENSQCSLSAAGTVITWAGNNLTVSLPITFKAAYTGAKQIWMYAAGAVGNSGWQQRGSWTAQ